MRTAYDWRGQEAALHEHPQFTTEVDGQTIRFLHARSPTHTPTAATRPMPFMWMLGAEARDPPAALSPDSRLLALSAVAPNDHYG
ncbi:epoxide hydrolase N-terminal domain-containing protein [Nonomuraea sp. 3-1Str]|uniref:epoxide hydrolase N-terminal domain-containing protein n=1 Tax=Nonomuraea sp. 3-1Str TaxID=2929801 RepID=UPI0037C74F97